MVDLVFVTSILLCAIRAMTILLLPHNICSEESHVLFLVHPLAYCNKGVSLEKKKGLCLLFPTSYIQIL